MLEGAWVHLNVITVIVWKAAAVVLKKGQKWPQEEEGEGLAASLKSAVGFLETFCLFLKFKSKS